MIKALAKRVGAQRWWQIMTKGLLFLLAALLALVILFAGGILWQTVLQRLGLIPTDWPIHFTAIPFVLSISAVLFMIFRRLKWVRNLDASNTAGAAAALAMAPFTVPVMVGYFFTGLFEIVSDLNIWLLPIIPARWILMVSAAAVVVGISVLCHFALWRVPDAARGRRIAMVWGFAASVLLTGWWVNWLGPTNGDGALMMAGALLCFATSIVSWQLPTLQAIAADNKWLTALLAGTIAICVIRFVFMTAEIVRFGFRAQPIVEGNLFEWAAYGVIPIAGLEMLKRWRGISPLRGSSLCCGIESVRDGLPSLSWTQEVSTGDTIGSRQDRFEIIAFSIAFPVTLYLGYRWGGWEGVFMAFILAGIFGGAFFRNAPVPDLSLPIMNGAGRGGPRGATTAAAQRAEAQLVTRREDCEAFLARDGDTIYFCVARGTAGQGAPTHIDRIPWDSFSNFEEASHKQWFRSQDMPDNMNDWSVIIAESKVPQVLLVAESVRSRARLIELLAKLQQTFIVPRAATLRAFRESIEERNRLIADGGKVAGTAAEHPSDVVPTKSF